MFYRIGLDIGTTSVGWCAIRTDEEGNPIRILDLGSRIFKVAEVAKTGASLAADRRQARGTRRRTRRRAERMADIKKLFATIIAPEYSSETPLYRVKALDEKITEGQFAAVLINIAKRRGYKSNGKAAENSKDGEILNATKANNQLLSDKQYRTVGEMFYKEYGTIKNGKVVIESRNTTDSYTKTVYRSDLENEIKQLFSAQRQFGNLLATPEMEKDYLAIFSRQRNFDEGPGKGSPYSGSYAIGNCTFYPEELRAPKASYTYERFTALNKLNNLRIKTIGSERPLTEEERNIILALIEKKAEVKFSDVRNALKETLTNDSRFSLLTYALKKKKASKKKKDIKVKEDETQEAIQITFEANATDIDDTTTTDNNDSTSDILDCEKAIFVTTKESRSIKKALEQANQSDIELIDEITKVLTEVKTDTKRVQYFSENPITSIRLSNAEIERLLELNPKKYGNLSFKAMRMILPYMEKGQVYSDACNSAGFNHSQITGSTKYKKLNVKEIYDKVDTIKVPVVKRAVSQTLKVLNAIIGKYGSPLAINVELARDLSKSSQERRDITAQNNARAEENQKAKEQLFEKFHVKPNSANLLKYRLYEEQGGKCVYSGETIDTNRLFEDNYVQVDHVLPYSRSFDDSFNNKVLVMTAENQNKKNRTPYEYLSPLGRFEDYVTRVRSIYGKNYKKLSILMQKHVDEEKMKSRALNDTRYISRFVLDLLTDNLLFEEGNMKKRRVRSVMGQMTAYLRHQWGITKVREDGDLHHAVDACIIAVATDSQIQNISNYNRLREEYKNQAVYIDEETGEVIEGKPQLSLPYDNFVEELQIRCNNQVEELHSTLQYYGYTEEELKEVKQIFVSRVPERKGKGAIHKDTIISAKHIEDGILVKRVPLTKLELVKDGNNYSIKDYYMPESDKNLYNLLLNRLIQYGDAEKAFGPIPDNDNPKILHPQLIYKPCAEGKSANIVKTVKLVVKYTPGFILEKKKGYAGNDSILRVDIFEKNGRYYGVPVYISDLYKGVLPDRAAVANKPYSEWTIMDDSYQFLFSLYQDDLVYMEHKTGLNMMKKMDNPDSKIQQKYCFKEGYLYFNSFKRTSGAAIFQTHDSCYEANLGIKTLKKLEKCVVDVLGNISKISKETRQPIGFRK